MSLITLRRVNRQKKRPCERAKRQRLIFPYSCPHSIFRAEELNYRVRDGNGCTLFALVTGSPAHTDVPTCYEIQRKMYFLNFAAPAFASSRRPKSEDRAVNKPYDH